MATNNNIKKFSAADIEKYHKGHLSAKERHDLEKAALDDPFLADALEGYTFAGVNTPADIAELKKRLAEKVEGAKVVSMHPGRKFWTPFLKVAAMIVVVAGAGLLVYQFAFNEKRNEVAQVTPGSKAEINTASTDTNTISKITENTSGLLSTETTKEKPKDNEAGPVGNTQENKPVPGTITRETVGEKTNETATSDIRPVATGGAPVVTAPAKADEKTENLERSGGKISGTEITKEEVKSKAPLAKKEGAEKDGMRDEAAKQQTDDSKNKRAVTANRQADDQSYRNQATNTFRGKVTDGSNTGLPFANVTNVQDNVGTYTDANGNFVLTSTDTVLNVQIRSLGYDNNNLQLRNDASSNKVVMQEDRKGLSEVVLSNQKPNTAARSKDANRKLIEPEPRTAGKNMTAILPTT